MEKAFWGKAEAVAVERMQAILPLCADGISKAERVDLQRKVAEATGTSYRTVGRWLAMYKEEGFDGLKPRPMPPQKDRRTVSEEALDLAIAVRRENPARSVEDLINILVSEGKARPGELKRSTLQRYLSEAGYSQRQMRRYLSPVGKAALRFQRSHRMDLVQGDIKFGPVIRVGGKPVQTYWICWIDDCTRFITHAEFYLDQTADSILDCLRKSIERAGLPIKIYVDGGSGYRSEVLRKTASRLGIVVRRCGPYQCQSKGKQERCNRDLDKFIEEARLADFESLEALNLHNKVWVEETHNAKGHSALPGGISPETAFLTDSVPLRYVDAGALDAAFILTKTDVKVDQTGILRFGGSDYQVRDMTFRGASVVVAWPPLHRGRLYVWSDRDGGAWTTAEPFVIGEQIDHRLKAALSAPEPAKAEGSRLFAALLKAYAGRHPDEPVLEDLDRIRRRDMAAAEERRAAERAPAQAPTFTALEAGREDR